jgi:hypothetical protein
MRGTTRGLRRNGLKVREGAYLGSDLVDKSLCGFKGVFNHINKVEVSSIEASNVQRFIQGFKLPQQFSIKVTYLFKN